ncbi:MAG TPA: gluconate 2-dehydrogenase subunit 3 family protein [Xanthobacteraceae bacterium]|jgi:gluconate 2-dehydrogenase gamma chain|nr:gluconate 2-dehydrogenase subunit 3 family protein [Xanthobacteraceae bacterium]
MSDDSIPRRRFLVGAGTAVATGLAASVPAEAQTPAAALPTPAAATHAEPEALLALTATEAAFVSAAVDAIIPADELSPSGTDCGLVTFIDRQLASAWGGGAKMYRSGPFQKGKPEQGYQLALTPKEFFQAGIAEANAWSHKTYGKEFDRLGSAQQIEALKAMEGGKAEFAGIPSRQFFQSLLTLAMEGFFSDPIYGGNRDKASWKMLGFPGLPATYAGKFEEYQAKRYVAPPQSIADFS